LVIVAVGFFTPAMFVLYLAFVSPEIVRRLPDRLKRHVRQRVDSRDNATEGETARYHAGMS